MKSLFYTISDQNQPEYDRNAGSKAVNDVNDILKCMGAQEIVTTKIKEKRGIKLHLKNAYYFKKDTDHIYDKGDSCLVLQAPIQAHSIFLAGMIKKLQCKKVKVILMIHDVDFVRKPLKYVQKKWSFFRCFYEENSLLKTVDVIIAHNESMKKCLIKHGIAEDKIVLLQIFDYLTGPTMQNSKKKIRSIGNYRIIIAGNLSPGKSQFIYSLPQSPQFLLYGANYEETRVRQNNIKYMGSFEPEELPSVMVGEFGLVWDGDSAETCSGSYGEYLLYNNPHKTSLYLVSGIPVIIWKEAALAPFILENHVGYTVESLYEISDLISNISDEEYQEMKSNAEKISIKLRSGYYFKRALGECLEKLDK